MPNVKPRPEKDCPTCDKHFVCVRPEQVYCSKKCIRGKGRAHLVCPCGVNTGSYQKKYCCDEHRERWGKKKAPVRMVTHICQNCDKPFERPWNYPNKKMFCSIKCSNQQHSRYRARHYEFGQFHLTSSYELRFVACLERLDIPWKPWPDDRPFEYGGHEYRPDFLVDGMAVETKGWDHPNSTQPEIRAAWNMSEPLVMVDREMLGRLEHIFGQNKFLDALRES